MFFDFLMDGAADFFDAKGVGAGREGRENLKGGVQGGSSIEIKKISSAHVTPISALVALEGRGLFESAYEETGKGRFSLLMVDVAFCLGKDEEGVFLEIPRGDLGLLGKKSSKERYQRVNLEEREFFKEYVGRKYAGRMDGVEEKRGYGDFRGEFVGSWGAKKSKKELGFLQYLAFFQSLAPSRDLLSSDFRDLPLPLGGMGYLGFEFFEEIEEGISQDMALFRKKGGIASSYECAFLFGSEYLVFDSWQDCCYILSIHYAGESRKRDLQSRILRIEEILRDLSFVPAEEKNYDYRVIARCKKSEFIQRVEEVKKRLARGDFLQCVLSQSLSVSSLLPPIEAYRRIRESNPSPYMFYLDFLDFVVLGTSPEMMVKLKDEQIFLRPIAGTRKRGENLARDMELEEELRRDVKENAEHLMLVDLARSDIGKVSEGGSVEVSVFKKIERYSRVMHIVSEVRGRLRKFAFPQKEAIFASFPAGTVSGAPKIEAIRSILELEPHKRGVYAGLVGYFDGRDLDSAIAIRVAVYEKGIYHLQAGAGIVIDSDASLEFEETQNKMLAIFESITNEGFDRGD